MKLSPMLRTIDIGLVILLIAIVAWTFKVKHDSQMALARVEALEKQISEERAEIDLLQSDWSLLVSPARLQTLYDRYSEELNLQGLDAKQMIKEDELKRVIKPQPKDAATEKEAAVSTDTQLTTGSIAKTIEALTQ